MAVRSNLVNRQYNTPINLYSQKNVDEALSRQNQRMVNGGFGIDFHQTAKPTNLANSAVLRMLEEEERSGRQKGFKRVAWPPPPDEADNNTAESEEPSHLLGSVPTDHSAPVRQIKQQGPQAPEIKAQSPPVNSYQPQVSAEPPKATVTLLPQAPIRQQPPPVFESQPATIRIKGGIRMRGDQKWPPENVKQQTEAENAARIALAKGPACRPRKVRKDYSQFFAQHALNPTYPGYRAPPGTQHYIEEGTSNL